MEDDFKELHACLCFLALANSERRDYLAAPASRQTYAYRQGHVETDNPLKVIALVLSEDANYRFESQRANQALQGIFSILEAMELQELECCWRPGIFEDSDDWTFGYDGLWDALRQLALIVLTELDWEITDPPVSCAELMNDLRVRVG